MSDSPSLTSVWGATGVERPAAPSIRSAQSLPPHWNADVGTFGHETAWSVNEQDAWTARSLGRALTPVDSPRSLRRPASAEPPADDAVPGAAVVVLNVAPETPLAALQAHFAAFGAVRALESAALAHGVAVVQFATAAAAQRALGAAGSRLGGRRLDVRLAEPAAESGGGGGGARFGSPALHDSGGSAVGSVPSSPLFGLDAASDAGSSAGDAGLPLGRREAADSGAPRADADDGAAATALDAQLRLQQQQFMYQQFLLQQQLFFQQQQMAAFAAPTFAHDNTSNASSDTGGSADSGGGGGCGGGATLVASSMPFVPGAGFGAAPLYAQPPYFAAPMPMFAPMPAAPDTVQAGRKAYGAARDSGSGGGNSGGGGSFRRRGFQIDLQRVRDGSDTRSSLMIRNIPNKYTQRMLLNYLEEKHAGDFDFFYLPIDFKNRANVGYAFVNLVSYKRILKLVENFDGKRWPRFNSEKLCAISYARIQGKQNLIQHFQNSSLMLEDKKMRPLVFFSDGPRAGQQQPFPLPESMTQASQSAAKASSPHTSPLLQRRRHDEPQSAT